MNMLSGLIDLIYPKVCEICDVKLGLDENILCKACLRKVILNTPPLCAKCARRLPFKKPLCFECKGRHSYLKQVWAWGIYDGTLKKCLHIFKHKKRKYIIEPFIGQIRSFAEQEGILKSIDMLVPVPLHPSNERDRTYNQAEIIAKILALRPGKPVVHALKKTKKTELQHFLSRRERKRNIENAFKAMDPGSLQGKSVLLVDDIFTTGATMNECARTLRQAGARYVYGFALARGN